MFGKEKKQKPIKKPRNKNQKNLLGLVLSILVAICVFVGLTSYQVTILNDYQKVTRVIAIKDIPSGILITEENAKTYFTAEEIEARHDVTAPVEKVSDMIGYISQSEIAKGQTISLMNFVEKDNVLAGVHDIVYLSFTVSKAGDALGGTVREGNIIDVNVATTKEVIEAGKSLYVNAVYDASYNRLTDEDTTPATTIEVGISAADADKFINAINSGSAYVSRRK